MEIRDRDGLTEQEFLNCYHPEDYARPSVAADMAIFTVAQNAEDNYRKLPEKELRLLLIQRGGHPYLGTWALPGGFVRPTETTEQAARRELQEETGVSNVYLEQLYTFSDPGRDPRTWVMSCSYMALADSGRMSVAAGDDAACAAWFRVEFRQLREHCWDALPTSGKDGGNVREYELILTHEAVRLSAIVRQEAAGVSGRYSILENDGLAFDHAKIITCAMERLRGKIEYTDIALNLMPEFFTLSELQQVYEIILGRELLAAAFRRKIGPLVEATGRTAENAGHRPSQLYRRKRGSH